MVSHNIWGSEKGSDVSGNFSNDHGVAFSFSSELLKFSLIVDIGKSVMILVDTVVMIIRFFVLSVFHLNF